MPQYHNAAAERATRYGEQASADFEEGTKARENGDHRDVKRGANEQRRNDANRHITFGIPGFFGMG